MADAQRIISGTSVRVSQTHTLEEGNTKSTMPVTDEDGEFIPIYTNARLGGTGSEIELDATSWGESTSSFGGHRTWEKWDSHWEDTGNSFFGPINVSSTAISLFPPTSDITATAAIVYCCVKNTGANAIKLSADGGSSYPFLIPPNGSVSFRGYSDTIQRNDIKVIRVSADSSFEFILF